MNRFPPRLLWLLLPLLIFAALAIWWRPDSPERSPSLAGAVHAVQHPHRQTWQAVDPVSGRWHPALRPVSNAKAEPVLLPGPGVTAARAGLRPRDFDRQRRFVQLAPGFHPARETNQTGRRLRFNLFPGVILTGTVTRHDVLGPERGVLYGYLEESPSALSQFTAAYAGDAVMAATVVDADQGVRYEIRPGQEGYHLVTELDETRLPGCGLHPEQRSIPSRLLPPLQSLDAAAKAARETEAAVVSEGPGAGVLITRPAPDPPSSATIDVMLLYSDDARANHGGTAGMEAILDLAVAVANAAYANSGIGLELRLVHRQEIAYSETGNFDVDLDNLTDGTGGLGSVAGLRTTHGADLVSMFLHTGNFGGLAFLFANDPALGFSVILTDAAIDTMAHEMGHNQGCAHDRLNAGVNGFHDYSFGWRTRLAGIQVRSIMAYDPGFPVPFFSNPDLELNHTPIGVAIGEPLQSANSATIQTTAPSIAQYLSPSSNQPPTVSLTSPRPHSSFSAMESITVTATASDDVAIDRVDFYLINSNLTTTVLGSVPAPGPYSVVVPALPSGEQRVAAVARDNAGAATSDNVLIGVGAAYTVAEVVPPAGYTHDLSVTAINEEGALTGYAMNTSAVTRAFLWDGTSLHTASPLAGDQSTELADLNASQVAVGRSISGSGSRAIRFTAGGGVEDLDAIIRGAPTNFADSVVAAYGISDAGAIVVEASTGLAYIWDGISTMTPLQSPPPGTPFNITATGMSSNGLVVGYDFDFGAEDWRAATWDASGVRSFLPAPVSNDSRAYAVNNNGFATGEFGFGPTSLAVWLDGFEADLGTLGGTLAEGRGINIHEDVVGYSTLSGQSDVRALLYRDGMVRRLEDVVWDVTTENDQLRWNLFRAEDINDRGWIAGSGSVLDPDPDDNPLTDDGGFFRRVFILKPTAGLDLEYWNALQFTEAERADPQVSGSGIDIDGDGKANLLEWAFNTDPRMADAYRPTFAIENGYLNLTFRQLKERAGLDYIVEFSSDLVEWTPATRRLHRVSLDASTDEVTVRAPVPTAGASRQFMRLRVVVP